MSLERNVDNDGKLVHPPVLLRALAAERMGPANQPESEWTAAVHHRDTRSEAPAKEFEEVWRMRRLAHSSGAVARASWNFQRPSFFDVPCLGTLDAAPRLVSDCVYDAMYHLGEYPGTPFADVFWFGNRGFCLGRDVSYDTLGIVADSPTYLFPFYCAPETAVLRGMAAPVPYRYCVVSASRTEPRCRRWPVPLFSGDCVILNAACRDTALGLDIAPSNNVGDEGRYLLVAVRFGNPLFNPSLVSTL